MASSIKGLDKLLSGLDKVSRDFQSEVKDIIGVNLLDLETQAIRDAPGDDSNILTEFGTERASDIIGNRDWKSIKQQISKEEYPDGFGGRVVVDKAAGDIAGWTEFGTGQSAKLYLSTVPKEWQETARKFYINGKGTILNAPYLYPAFTKYSLQTIKELKQAMKDIRL